MCSKAVNLYMLGYVPNEYKTQEMCEKPICSDSCILFCNWFLQFVSDWLFTTKILEDFGGGWSEWFDNQKHCKSQKVWMKHKLLPVAWYPSQWWDWCVSEDKKISVEEKVHHYRAYSSRLLRAVIVRNHLPFFKISKYLCPIFLPFFSVFLKIARMPLLSRISPALGVYAAWWVWVTCVSYLICLLKKFYYIMGSKSV